MPTPTETARAYLGVEAVGPLTDAEISRVLTSTTREQALATWGQILQSKYCEAPPERPDGSRWQTVAERDEWIRTHHYCQAPPAYVPPYAQRPTFLMRLAEGIVLGVSSALVFRFLTRWGSDSEKKK